MRGSMCPIVVALAVLASSSPAVAAPILQPSPALETKAASYAVQEDIFSTRENGLFLDPIIKPADVPVVQAFFGQTVEPDFTKQTGRAPFDVVADFDEYGDEGNFSGVASVGLAARLLVLRQNGAPSADVTRARNAAVRAARAWHVYGAIGGLGVVARGVRRIKPENAGDVLPGVAPALVPLNDGSGPLPVKKAAVWRAPVLPGFSDWIWFDDTSKDQVSGYALAVVWLWDALHDDPAVPAGVTDALARDLAAFANSLMTVAPETGVDLCVRDGDGRLTSIFDINPRNLGSGPPLPEQSTLRNGFNAAMALGILRAAYHVSGDPDIGRYYYEELVGARDLPSQMATNAGMLFLGAATNFSNANMLAISLATLGRVETDPYVRGKLDETLTKQFWSTGDSRDASHAKQAWFDAVYGSYAAAPDSGLDTRIGECLLGMQGAPAFERDRVNCDAAELAGGVCLAVDGVTKLTLSKEKGWGGTVVADSVVPWSVRPDSDFEWRSDPFRVNGTASTRLDPGGDFLAAYWLARLSDTSTSKNVSPFARVALPWAKPDAGGPSEVPVVSSGCGCRTATPGAPDVAWVLGLVALIGLRRRAR